MKELNIEIAVKIYDYEELDAADRELMDAAREATTSKARNGDTVRVAFDPHKVHLFDVETEQTILN